MRITIPGAPRGKARPRVTRRGTYTPEETKRYEELVRACWAKEGGERFKDDTALNVLIMDGVVPHPQKHQQGKADGNAAGAYPTRKKAGLRQCGEDHL